MKRLLIAGVVLVGLGSPSAHADALPNSMLGCWDMPTAAESTDAEGLIRRGSGKDCEADYVITQDEFSAVDDYCKITKVKRLSKTAYEVAADCDGEGGEHESNVSVFELRNDKLYITVVPKG